MDEIEFLTTGPAKSRFLLALAHGAGAPMDSPFMNTIADGLADRGVRVDRFEFPYMAARRTSDRRPPPNRAPVLMECWRNVIAAIGKPDRIYIGGKSMGGRIASMVADEVGVKGLVCLGYPFHPPGKPERLRTEHLRDLSTPALFLQGERDTFGTRQEVAEYDLSEAIRFEWLPDGDHSLKPRKASGFTEQQNLEAAVQAIASFVGASST